MGPQQRIGIVGTFDVANFGDLLFPLLAEHELRRRLGELELLCYSHRAMSPDAWPYAVRALDRLPADLGELDLLVVGGGDLIRFDRTVAPGYDTTSPTIHHPTGYWMMPTLLAASDTVPVAWNAVGVVSPIPDWASTLLALAAGSADYVAVRDDVSLAALERAAGFTRARLVPDTAFGIASLVAEAPAALTRTAPEIDQPFVVVQPSPHLAPHAEEIRTAATALAAAGLVVVELPISPVFGESPSTLQLGDGPIRPAEWPHPLAIAELIGRAEAVVAHSLHLSIVALALGTPVFRRPAAPESKYAQLEQFDGVRLWETAADLQAAIESGRGQRGRPESLVGERVAQLAVHWDTLAELAGARSAPDPKLRAHVVALAVSSSETSALVAQELATTHGELATTREELAAARSRVQDLEEGVEHDARALAAARSDLTTAGAHFEAEQARVRALHERELEALRAQVAVESAARVRLEEHLALVFATKSWRLLAPLRAGYRRLRGAGGGPRGAAGTTRPEEPPPADDQADACDPAALAERPLVSVIMPTFDTPPRLLGKAIASVREQTYPDWELCVCDDGSTSTATREALAAAAGADDRVRVVFADRNEGIAAASNRALELARGEFVAFLDHDDELTADALCRCVQAAQQADGADVVYTDQDKVDDAGRRFETFFKPDWSPEYARRVMYVGHLLFVRRELVRRAGGLDSRFDGIQDYELLLRLSELTDRIAHVPRILYHWRATAGSIASSHDAKGTIGALQATAVTAHLRRTGIRASARPHPRLPHRVQIDFEPPAEWPTVSVVIPTKDAPELIGPCLESLFGQTTYPSLEVVVVDTGTTDPGALAILDRHPIVRAHLDGPFNFARACNEGVARASGRHVVLLNNDTEIVTPDWLQELVALLELPGIGAVGPLLLYPDGTVQHAGVVLGMRGTADHIMRGFPADSDGYAGTLSCTREVSAVTAACLALPRALYEDVGGLSEWYSTHYQDVDLCLRLRERGLRILCAPEVRLVHHESVSRGSRYDMLDRSLLLDVWGETIARGDPYYNPNLELAEGSSYEPRGAAAAA